jgi:hypothetical protein
MKYLFIFLFLFRILAAQIETDLDIYVLDRWVNEKGWPIPDVGKMNFEKSKVIKNIIPDWICVKTFVDKENEIYTVRTNKIEKYFIVSKEIGELNILKVSVYYLCEAKEVLVYFVRVLDVEYRDEDGITGMVRDDFYVDLNQDGIFESRYEGSGCLLEDSNCYSNKLLKYLAEKWKSQKCMSQQNKKK